MNTISIFPRSLEPKNKRKSEEWKNFSAQWTELNAFQNRIDSDDAANHEKCLGMCERQFKTFSTVSETLSWGAVGGDLESFF